jgi:hypothetical protein
MPGGGTEAPVVKGPGVKDPDVKGSGVKDPDVKGPGAKDPDVKGPVANGEAGIGCEVNALKGALGCGAWEGA